MSADVSPLPPPAPPLGALDPDPEPALPLEPPEVMHKTRAVEFLGRRTPIVYQNDNGPCPLLAICNVLLLKNVINLNPDAGEVSQQKLLSLVAERLIDSNSSAQAKDEEYVRNWEHNISDAIDLLPRLTTGIDVNVMFRKVDDFEFTPERAIFDLLDIPLYHGWIIDPQDTDTASAIGSKSYNALASGLAEFKSGKPAEEDKHAAEEETVDFAAATAAALGVPSPNVSIGRSFDESTLPDSAELQLRRGDREEDEELRRVLNLSKAESTNAVDGSVSFSTSQSHSSSNIEETPRIESSGLEAPETVGSTNKEEGSDAFPHDSILQNTTSDANVSEAALAPAESEQTLTSKETEEDGKTDMPAEHLDIPVQSSESTLVCPSLEPSVLDDQAAAPTPVLREANKETCRESSAMQLHDTQASDAEISCDLASVTSQATPSYATLELDEKIVSLDTAELASSSIQGNEPIYQGEEHILGTGNVAYQTEEPVYEGEVVLAEQADKTGESSQCLENGAADHQWDLIDNFLQSTANQLTVYGLFCLQEGLKERELCVFFRNNHFNTMFKYNGSLYLLATDQGFFGQSDLVWQKLDEVNGDGIFVTSNFTLFTAETPRNDSWNQQQAMTTTAVDIVISQAHATPGTLMSQRSTFGGITTKISNVSSRIPTVRIMYEQRKKEQEKPEKPEKLAHKDKNSCVDTNYNFRSMTVTSSRKARPPIPRPGIPIRRSRPVLHSASNVESLLASPMNMKQKDAISTENERRLLYTPVKMKKGQSSIITDRMKKQDESIMSARFGRENLDVGYSTYVQDSSLDVLNSCTDSGDTSSSVPDALVEMTPVQANQQLPKLSDRLRALSISLKNHRITTQKILEMRCMDVPEPKSLPTGNKFLEKGLGAFGEQEKGEKTRPIKFLEKGLGAFEQKKGEKTRPIKISIVQGRDGSHGCYVGSTTRKFKKHAEKMQESDVGEVSLVDIPIREASTFVREAKANPRKERTEFIAQEDAVIRMGVKKFAPGPKERKPWKQILALGKRTGLFSHRTANDLKGRWRTLSNK